jgi:hypothetical protein
MAPTSDYFYLDPNYTTREAAELFKTVRADTYGQQHEGGSRTGD